MLCDIVYSGEYTHTIFNRGLVGTGGLVVLSITRVLSTAGTLGRGRRGLCLQCRVMGTGSTLIWGGAGRPLGAVRALPPGGRRPMVAALAVHTHSAHVWKSSLNNHTFFFT